MRKEREARKVKNLCNDFYESLFGKLAIVKPFKQPSTGVGLIARTTLKKGSVLPVFGTLHRSSHRRTLLLDKVGDPNPLRLEQRTRSGGKRTQWYYVAGPASLLNHSCKHFNAEFVLDKCDADSSFSIKALRTILEGEEVLVNYGDDYWSGIGLDCACATCTIE
jgi:SET domain-containing protein